MACLMPAGDPAETALCAIPDIRDSWQQYVTQHTKRTVLELTCSSPYLLQLRPNPAVRGRWSFMWWIEGLIFLFPHPPCLCYCPFSVLAAVFFS